MTYFGFVFYLHINFKGNYSDSLRDAKDATDIRPLLVKAMVTGNCNVTLVSFRNSDRLTVIMSLRLKSSHHQDLRHSTLAYFMVWF